MQLKSIVVTRPPGQDQELIDELKTSFSNICLTKGLQLPQVLSLPLLGILPKTDKQLPKAITSILQQADFAIFVSPNAIECVMRLFKIPKNKRINLTSAWQEISNRIIPIGVMGQSSAEVLDSYGIGLELHSRLGSLTPIFLPGKLDQWDSEGLWKEMQKFSVDWTKCRIVIFKGDGGREWLASTLKNAGAHVDAISVYTRVPLSETSPFWKAVKEIDLSHSLWILTSSEAVRHLGGLSLSKLGKDFGAATALCPHQNIANAARDIGFGKVLISPPGKDGLVKASCDWFSVFN